MAASPASDANIKCALVFVVSSGSSFFCPMWIACISAAVSFSRVPIEFPCIDINGFSARLVAEDTLVIDMLTG